MTILKFIHRFLKLIRQCVTTIKSLDEDESYFDGISDLKTEQLKGFYND